MLRFSKKTALALILMLMCIVLFQLSCASQKALYSPFTQHFLKQLETELAKNKTGELNLSDKIQKDFLVRQKDGQYVVHGKIIVELSVKESDLEPLNIIVNTKLDQLWTVAIPITSLKSLGKVKGVNFIEIDVPIYKK